MNRESTAPAARPPGPALTALVERARSGFQRHFDRPATVVVQAPGRVNLIGDHTDYNDGFVLPMAIDRHVVIAADRSSAASRIHSSAFDETATIAAPSIRAPDDGPAHWSHAVAGVVELARCSERDPGQFDAWIESTVPVASGLASSAALEVATATLVEALTGRGWPVPIKARVCQQAEHIYAGVPCGIMDQFVVAGATGGHAMLLDCRTLDTSPIPLSPAAIAVMIIDTRSPRELAEGTYAARRDECAQAAAALGTEVLRDVTLPELEAARDRLSDIQFRRARHVISENARTLEFAAAANAGDWMTAGTLMMQSHDSLAGDFAVTVPALDSTVALAGVLGRRAGVFGARMTGAGMGGSVVALVDPAAADDIASRLLEACTAASGVAPAIMVTPATGGAGIIEYAQ